MKKVWVFLFGILTLVGCEKTDMPSLKQTRLKSYNIVYADLEKTEVYRGLYNYDMDGNLIGEVQNDTTYLINSNQIVPVKTTIDYEYDEDGFLVKRTRKALSIRLTATAVTDYEYRNGLLSLENFGNRVREYRYGANGKLETTIFTSLNSGNKTVTAYDDDIPKELEKTTDGFLFVQEEEKTFLDKDLLVKRYEKYKDGNLIFEQDYIQQKKGLPQSNLPNFKGFPKIKAFDYQKGIENQISTYRTIDGIRGLSDEKILSSTFNDEGLLIRNEGFEHINQHTSAPLRRDLLFEYEYEKY